MGGGYPCFVVSIAMIGLLTCIVGDLAGIFGCLVGLKDSVTGKKKQFQSVKSDLALNWILLTAITFVALGTSLPDTFASKAAAVGEKHADNAIGNVTGSNSVNVFLGLGLPWLIAAIYWEAQVRRTALVLYFHHVPTMKNCEGVTNELQNRARNSRWKEERWDSAC